MIYSMEKNIFPKEGQYSECHSYKDENDFEWRIARVKNGFFVGYFGDEYFSPTTFEIRNKEGEDIYFRIKNTRCFFIQDTDFETFYEFRNIIKTGWTDDIWESIQSLLTERLLLDDRILECEIYKKK